MIKKRQPGFILLEVLVAIIVIAVALVALLRGFVIGMDTLTRIRSTEKGLLLARSFVDDMILEPPAEGSYEGKFEEDDRYGEGFKGWKWRLVVESEEPDYDERPKGNLFTELELIYYAQLEIFLEENNREELVVRLDTILMDPEIFSDQAIQMNQLF